MRLVHLLPMILLATPSFAGDEEDPLAVPISPDLPTYIRDMESALALGKALFWDEQASSDGRVACATCHFAGGGDIRTVASIHPGPNGIFEEDGTRWPFESDDVFGSQGVSLADFEGIVLGQAIEDGTPLEHPIFGRNRQVTGRNAPAAVNAVIYNVQFWDGRAAQTFNGVNGEGERDPDARVLLADPNGRVEPVSIRVQDASLASQAVGPILSEVEMSFRGRTFPDVGKKLLSLRPLALQEVHRDDSALGQYRSADGSGLRASYSELIRRAFRPEWWRSDVLLDRDKNVIGSGTPSSTDEFTLMEANFSLFWGLSILVYESTLVADDSPYDRFLAGDRNALTRAELRGLEVYEEDGRCDKCHGQGPELSNAGLLNGGNGRAFTNTGVRPPFEDIGRGAGEFKSVTVRINELNGPYFHNGGYLTLRQVVDFYDRGGDFPNDDTNSQVRELELTERQKRDLVSFMLATTDERVRYQRAPFDHPSLNLPDGDPLPAVGRAGGPPIPRFLNADPFAR